MGTTAPHIRIDHTAVEMLPNVGPVAWAVYCVLKYHTGVDGTCWPSTKTVAQEVGITDRAVRRALRALQAALLIVVQKRRTGAGASMSNLFRMLSPSPNGEADRNDIPRQSVQGEAEQNDREGRNETTSHPRNEAPVELTPIRTNTSEPTPRNNSSCPKLRFDEADTATARWIFGLIKAMNPTHRQPNIDQWANEIRLMRERDHRRDEEIRQLFGWANADPFWRANILSPAKLRAQWDQLIIKRTNGVNGNGHGQYKNGAGQRQNPAAPCEPI